MTLTRKGSDFFVFALMFFLILTLPVSQAASISYLSPAESATVTPATVESRDAKIRSAAVSEVIINVSKDGKISIIGPNETDIPVIREVPESSQNVSVQDDNVCSRADNLELNAWYSAYIDYKGDIDWSKWDLPSSGKLTAELDVPSGKDYDLQVYSGCSSLRCTSASGHSKWYSAQHRAIGLFKGYVSCPNCRGSSITLGTACC